MLHETDSAKQHLLMRDFESYVLDDPGARDLLALVASDRPLSVLRQGLEDQPETLPQPGFGYSLAPQIGKAYEPAKKKPRRLHDYYYRRRLEPDFFLCGLELRPELFQILEGQGRAFWVSRPWALVDEG